MKALKLIYALVFLMALGACEKESHSSLQNIELKNEGEHPELDTVDIETIYQDENYTVYEDPCVEVVGGILTFDSFDCYWSFYESLLNQTESNIDLWENNIGFSSLYSHYVTLYQDPNNDDWASDSLRIPNPLFERMLNVNHEMKIGDFTYTYDFINQLVDIYDNTNGQSITANIEMEIQQKTQTHCSSHHTPHVSGTISSGNTKLKIQKVYIEQPAIISGSTVYTQPYTQLYIITRHYKKNWLGKWKRNTKTARLVNHIDRWHEVQFDVYRRDSLGEPLNYLSSKTITNKRYIAKNTRANIKFFYWWHWMDNTYPYPYKVMELCVNKFERFHCYTYDYNDDVHHDFW